VGSQRLAPDPELLVLLRFQAGREAERLVDADRLVLALDLDAVDLAEGDVFHALPRALAHQDAHAVVLGAAFEARGHIHGVAHRGVGAPQLRAHVTDTHHAAVHADADGEPRPAARGEPPIERPGRPLHVERRQHGAARLLRIFDRRAPERHDAVAHVLNERALILATDDVAHLG